MKKREAGQPTQAGAIHLLAIIVIGGILLLLLSAAAYYMVGTKNPYDSSLAYPSASPISESDDTKTIESELNATDGQSPDKDIEDLGSSASSL